MLPSCDERKVEMFTIVCVGKMSSAVKIQIYAYLVAYCILKQCCFDHFFEWYFRDICLQTNYSVNLQDVSQDVNDILRGKI